MIKQISGWMAKQSDGRLVLSSMVMFILFITLVLPDQATKAAVYSGDVGSPDISLFYTAEMLYQMAEAFGPEGRAAYIRARFTFDVVWPLVYVVFLVSSISWLYQRIKLPGKFWQCLNLVPLFGMGFDFLENSSAAVVMARYPNPTALLAHLAGIFTLLKWVFISSSFVILVVGCGLLLWRLLQNRKTL